MSDVILAGLTLVVFAAFIIATLSAVRLNKQTRVLEATTARLNEQTALMDEHNRRLADEHTRRVAVELEQGEQR